MEDILNAGAAFAVPLVGAITFKALEKICHTPSDSGEEQHTVSMKKSSHDRNNNEAELRKRKNIPRTPLTERLSKAEILDLRSRHLGPSCMLFFKQDPLKVDHAAGQYMYDEEGVRYIDCINNVAHVGHCHPSVTQAAYEQMQKLYTNSRYLHSNLVTLAERLTETMPGDLKICYFTNSGSEANDMALQLARMYAQSKDVITLDNAYHGTVTSLQEINPYKWKQTDNKTSAMYKMDWSHVIEAPDSYRGSYRSTEYDDEQLTDLYISQLQTTIDKLAEKDRKPAAFIAESMQSCGGQVIYPKNYLLKAKQIINKSGGLLIIDEVQTGFGRVGESMWAFQHYGSDLLPDIVTVGKPMGNGHPIAAVITSKRVADTFKLPYFNTYGGNPVSCAVALSVLNIIKDENLQDHACIVGAHLRKRLEGLMKKHQLIGDIRGVGLFMGVDLVLNRETKQPATDVAGFIIAKLRHDGVLLSRDGPHENVLKFKPPMCITSEDLDEVCDKIDALLYEVEQKLQIDNRRQEEKTLS